jgi:hypothetical protein
MKPEQIGQLAQWTRRFWFEDFLFVLGFRRRGERFDPENGFKQALIQVQQNAPVRGDGGDGGDPPGFVLKLSGLTPADFATVARKASVLGERDSKTVAQWLESEAQAKPDAERPRIGF